MIVFIYLYRLIVEALEREVWELRASIDEAYEAMVASKREFWETISDLREQIADVTEDTA